MKTSNLFETCAGLIFVIAILFFITFHSYSIDLLATDAQPLTNPLTIELAKTDRGRRLLALVLKDILEQRKLEPHLEPKPKSPVEEPVSFVSNNTLGFDYPFTLQDRRCLLKLGDCLGAGCDGPIWKCSVACDDGFVQPMAVKFKRDHPRYGLVDSDWTLESLLKSEKDKMDLLAIPVAKVRVDKQALLDHKGSCRYVSGAEAGKRLCGKLLHEMFENPEETVLGDVMPIFQDRLCESRLIPEAREFAFPLIRNLARSFETLVKERILHCDFNAMHVGLAPKTFGIGMALEIFDLNRHVYCKPKDESCDFKFRTQMWQFGSLVIDFCTPTEPCLDAMDPDYMWTSGPCKLRKIQDPQWLAEEVKKEAMPRLEERFKMNWKCPKQEILKKAVRLAYAPIQYPEIPMNWTSIIELLDQHMGEYEPSNATRLEKEREERKRLKRERKAREEEERRQAELEMEIIQNEVEEYKPAIEEESKQHFPGMG